MVARLLLLAAAACALQDEPLYSLEWPGPVEGCAGAPRPGGHYGAECALGAGRLLLATDAAGSYLKLTCQDVDGSFSCAELEQAAPLLRAHVAAPPDERGRAVERLEIGNCVLPREPLACALRLVRAADARLLALDDVAGELRPAHVAGMSRVEKLRLYYRRGENQTTVPYDVLAKLPALISFSLWRGAVVLRPAEGLPALPALPGLRSLELADGGLRSVPRGAFRNAPGVTTLQLWGNQIENVDENALEGLAQLENLSLNSNRLAALPRAVFAPSPRLARADLYNNQLAELPPGLFDGLLRLREVYIFDNQAALRLPDRLFANLPALQHLELKTSSIRDIPEHLFENTTNLQKLYISGNNLTSLPAPVFRALAHLQLLDLSNNRLRSLHEGSFAECGHLESLDLSGNLLKDVPEGVFSGLSKVRVLNLAGNKFETLSKTVFSGLAALRELFLAGNRIQTLHSETFGAVTALEILSLANNNMSITRQVNTVRLVSPELYGKYQLDHTSAPVDEYEYHSPLRELVNLRKLDLSRNRVALLCDDWRMFWSLRELDLAHNELTALTDMDLAFSSNSVSVDLRHNRITRYRPYAYLAGDSAPKTTPTVYLDDNPFSCDCRLYPAVKLLRRAAPAAPATNVVIDSAACAAPPALRTVRLAELRPEQLTCSLPDCPGDCSCTDIPAQARIQFDCLELPARLPQRVTHLRVRRPADLRRLPARVGFLDLSALNLTEAPTVAHAVEIDLTGNHLKSVPVDLLKLNCVVHLANNPLECGCGDRAALELLRAKRHLVRDYNNLTCGNKLLLSGVRVDALCAARDAAIVGCCVALFGVLLAVGTGLAYRYQTIVRILLRKVGLWWGEDDTDDRMYDAFVSFSHRDEKYVMDTLVPRLESGRRPLRLCVHYRDWIIGDFIPSQIARSVEDSRRTIIVLSEHFLQSVWAQMEFRAAHGRERLLILMLDDLAKDIELDPDLKAYISVNTFVRADDPLVYDRLKDAVLTKRRAFVQTHKDADKAAGLDVHLNERGELVNGAVTVPS